LVADADARSDVADGLHAVQDARFDD